MAQLPSGANSPESTPLPSTAGQSGIVNLPKSDFRVPAAAAAATPAPAPVAAPVAVKPAVATPAASVATPKPAVAAQTGQSTAPKPAAPVAGTVAAALAKPPPPSNLPKLVELLKGEKFAKEMREAVISTGLYNAELDATVSQFVEVAQSMVVNPANPNMGYFHREWAPDQVVETIVKLARKGCMYNPLLGLGWILPFENNKGQPSASITLVAHPGVRGQERVLQRTGKVGFMKALAVRATDKFEWDELNPAVPPKLQRSLVPLTEGQTQPPIIAAVAVIFVIGAGYHTVVMPINHAQLIAELKAKRSIMTPDDYASNKAYRKAMREVGNTYLHNNPAVLASMDAHEVDDQLEMQEGLKPLPAQQGVPQVPQVPQAPVSPVGPPTVVPTAPVTTIPAPALNNPVDSALASGRGVVKPPGGGAAVPPSGVPRI